MKRLSKLECRESCHELKKKYSPLILYIYRRSWCTPRFHSTNWSPYKKSKLLPLCKRSSYDTSSPWRQCGAWRTAWWPVYSAKNTAANAPGCRSFSRSRRRCGFSPRANGGVWPLLRIKQGNKLISEILGYGVISYVTFKTLDDGGAFG